MLKKIEKIVFFLITFFLISQAGLHLWPSFSKVSGLRVDYLSPTLYLTDILIVILFLVFLLEVFLEKNHSGGKSKNRNQMNLVLLTLFIFSILFSLLLAQEKGAAIFGILKLVEFIFLGFYVASRFEKKDISAFIDTLSFGAIFVSIIAIWQLIKQGSIGGILYFLGERTFNSSTIGIATFTMEDRIILRPYATFPHPNVLAFFLFFVITLIIPRIFNKREEKAERVFLSIALIISSIALFLSFSRVIIFVLFLVLFYYLTKFVSRKSMVAKALFLVILGLLAFYFSRFSGRFFNLGSILGDLTPRYDLIDISFQIYRDSPYFGVGINNFFIYQEAFQKTISPTLLQPVHNIYLLVLVQTGMIGLAFFIWFLFKSLFQIVAKVKSVKGAEFKEFYRGVFVVFTAALFVGFFDHFFLTLQQGQLMFALILGLVWARIK